MRLSIATKVAAAGLVVAGLGVIPACEPGSFVGAQEQPAAQEKSGGKTRGDDKTEATKPTTRAKPGTKQAVEARLKAAERAKAAGATGPIHEVGETLFSA